MSHRQPDNARRAPNHSRSRSQQNHHHQNPRGTHRNVSRFNPNASEFIPQGSNGNTSYHQDADPRNMTLPAAPSSYSGQDIRWNQSQNDTQGTLQRSGLISLPAVSNLNQIFGSRPVPQSQNQTQSVSGYPTPYQNYGNLNPIDTIRPGEQQNMQNMVSGQPMNHIQQQQFPTPYGGFPLPPRVIHILPADQFFAQYTFLSNEYSKLQQELERLRGDGVERRQEAENNHSEVCPSRNVVDAETQTDTVTNKPGETQTYVSSKSIGVQYEEMSVEEGLTVLTTDVSLPRNKDVSKSAKVQMEDDVKSDVTKSVALSIDSTPGATDVVPVGKGSGPTAHVTPKSPEVPAIASSLPVSIQHKETSGATRHRLEEEDPLVSASALPSNSVVTTVTDTQSISEHERAPIIQIDPESPENLRFATSQSMGNRCQDENDITGVKGQTVGVSPSKSNASVAASDTSLITSFNQSDLREQKDQSERSQVENSENIALIQSKPPTKSPKNLKGAKKARGKATKQGNKNPHALEMGTDDDEELNRAIEDTKRETIVRNEFQSFMETRVKSYFKIMDSYRYQCFAFIKERPKGHEFFESIMEYFKKNLSQLHNINYRRSDRDLESLLKTRITKYSASQEAEDWKLCMFFKLIYAMFDDTDTGVIVTQDLLYLFDGKKNDCIQRSFDTRYYQMMAESDSWQPAWLRAWLDSNPSMSAADLPPNTLDEKSISSMVNHVNEQAKQRYLRDKKNQVTHGSEHVPPNDFQKAREEKIDWSPAKTKKFFQERCEFWRNFKNRNADQSKLILYYELLASFTSSVIDFDAYFLSQRLQNVAKKGIEKICFEERTYMYAVFSSDASGDEISKS